MANSSLATASVSLPSALQGFSMFAGSSVWSPAAVSTNGQQAGWAAAGAVAGTDRGWAGLPPGFPGTGSSAAAMHVVGTLPSSLGASASAEDLHGLGEELQANDLAQGIMRTVVEG